MALRCQFFYADGRYLRVVTADSQADQDSAENIPPGTTLYRTDTLAAWRWNGTAWVSAEGGTPGPQGDPGIDGQDGRSIAVFEQAGEPLSAVAGDLWIVP